MDMTFDIKYDMLLKVLYKHFTKCPFNSMNLPNNEHCADCAKVKPSMLETLHEAPVFIIEAEKLTYFTQIFEQINMDDAEQITKMLETSLSSKEPLVRVSYEDNTVNTSPDTGIISRFLAAIKATQKTLDKGYPFEQFIVLLESPPVLNNKMTFGCLFRELDPEHWLKFPVAFNTKERAPYCTSGGVFGVNDGELKALEHLLNVQEKVELEDFNIKARVGYYNPALPRTAKAKPIHIVYFETKKQFILKHPQYEAKILREPKLAHLVRGHWRKLHDGQKHGKDRHGYPIFNGYTWVIPHKRGKGDLPETTIYVAQ